MKCLAYRYINIIISAGEDQDFSENHFRIHESGEHAAEYGVSKRGIHGFWAKKADALLLSGVMPKQALIQLWKEGNADTRKILPTVEQLRNRKRSIFKPSIKLDTQHALKQYLNTYRVSNFHNVSVAFIYYLV